ncbi:[Fe-Fe] hydrogenase large subunit C-terminal domain-containing protein [Peptococcaceae bacterium 1198_IL3148]
MGLITTNEAKCLDCYKCVRTCPVKAIAISNTNDKNAPHVSIIDELCVKGGCCIEICPQSAKKLNHSDLEQVKQLLANGEKLVCTVAPSFVAAVPLSADLMPSLLRQLGFEIVEETSVGAGMVSRRHLQIGFEEPLISSSCPVIVNLVERYYPELISMLAPVVSPMIAHGRYLKQRYPDAKVVFVGPCVAKKDEYTTASINDAVDFVLGFNELWQLVEQLGVDLNSLFPAKFDNPVTGDASLYPLDGGMFKGIKDGLSSPDEEYFSASGLEDCMEFLNHLAAGNVAEPPKLIELLACKGGCINGPLALDQDQSLYARKRKVLNYYQSFINTADDQPLPELPVEQLTRSYQSQKLDLPLPTEADLREILAKTGKVKTEDELNCGACGYDTCRDKAVAVFQGKAEVEMCIPYMRKRAESLSNVVTSAMPNGIIIADEGLKVLEINPAAEKLFNISASKIVGENLSALINTSNFNRAVKDGSMIHVCCTYPDRNIVTSEFIFPVVEENIVVGIFVDITEEKRQREQFELIKNQTIMQSQEVIEKQMMVAQEIAGLLGEATAESKIQLTKLIKLMREEPQQRG